MKKFLVLISLCQFILSANIYAKENYSILVGGGYIAYALDHSILSDVEDGYSFNFSIEKELHSNFSLYFSTSFQSYSIDEKETYKFFSINYGLTKLTEPENTNVYEFSLGTKLYIQKAKISPYLGIGIGLLHVDINWRTREEDYALFIMNLGSELKLSQHFAVIFDSKLFISYSGPANLPITALIKYYL